MGAQLLRKSGEGSVILPDDVGGKTEGNSGRRNDLLHRAGELALFGVRREPGRYVDWYE